jgi:hypothetical protein
MTRSMKAVLLSALVFPGAGHFYLKKRLAGAILVGATLFGLYALTTATLDTAMQVVDRIERGEVQPDATAISELLEQQSASGQGGSAGARTGRKKIPHHDAGHPPPARGRHAWHGPAAPA